MSMSTTDAHGTSVIVHDVHVDHREHYERWMLKAIQAHASFPGFLATDVIRPVGSGLRFIVVVRFESEAGAQAWLASDTRARLLVEAMPWLLSEDRYHVHCCGWSGLTGLSTHWRTSTSDIGKLRSCLNVHRQLHAVICSSCSMLG
jgi:antibiotic biosynthesis monooxygenase (ABM) superfamily enzyme